MSPDIRKIVQDNELREWLSADGDDERELIVQAKTPPRKVTVTRTSKGSTFSMQMDDGVAAEREAAIVSLAKSLETILDEPPVILKSSGVLVVKATSRQAKSFVTHPMVKAIYPNRPLKKGVSGLA